MKEYIKKILKKIGFFDYLRVAKSLYYQKKYFTLQAKESFVKNTFFSRLGYDIDFNNEPQSFNQKIQFRKLYDKNPLYAICADKYRVRKYVQEKIGQEYLTPLIFEGGNLSLQEWKKLPKSFVAKANHNSGPVQIVKDKEKANAKKIINELSTQLAIDFGAISMESYYSDIPRKIIVEEFLQDDLMDYKFHCFSNKKIFLEIITQDGEFGNMYDPFAWKKLDFTTCHNIDTNTYEKPKNFDTMLKNASILADGFEYVRVDFYNVDGKIYFGEMTFCNQSGFNKFTDKSWDLKFGEFWNQHNFKSNFF